MIYQVDNFVLFDAAEAKNNRSLKHLNNNLNGLILKSLWNATFY